MTDGIPASAWILVGQSGASCWAEGLLDVLAGDLVVAGYAVGVDVEQDPTCCVRRGQRSGGRGAGGQPQRQHGMAKVVGAGRLGACPVYRNGCGAGLSVPNTRAPGRSGHFIAGTAPARRRPRRTTITPSMSATSSMTRDDNPESTIPASAASENLCLAGT